MEDREVLEQWLNGLSNVEELTHFLQDHHADITTSHWLIMIHQIHKSKSSDLTYYKLFTRNVLEKLGFYSVHHRKATTAYFYFSQFTCTRNV